VMGTWGLPRCISGFIWPSAPVGGFVFWNAACYPAWWTDKGGAG